MKLYSYTMPKTRELSPNPYFNYCTLAIGKPIIRKCAEEGDWIAVYGSADTAMYGKLIVLMRVEEILTYDEYWEDSRFEDKRPAFDKGIMYTYGDNIYHHAGFKWVQEQSRYGMKEQEDLKRDTQTNRVLIATEFYYFGENAIAMPQEFSKLVAQGAGHSVCADKNLIEAFLGYMRGNYDGGMQGNIHCSTAG